MLCKHPYEVKYVDYLGYNRSYLVGCGKCIHCVKKRQNDWSIRLYEESRNWPHVDFVTFTYNNSSLPLVECVDPDTGEQIYKSTLHKEDLTAIIKRMRIRYKRKFGADLHMKYFCCGEYGSHGTKRPHYHGLFMYDCDPLHMQWLYSQWRDKFGHILVKRVGCTLKDSMCVSRYVGKYLTKSFFCSRRDDIEIGDILPPSYFMSKSIGASYVERFRHYHTSGDLKDIIERMCYRFGDSVYAYGLPRYYKERLFKREERKIHEPVELIYDNKNFQFLPVYLPARNVVRFTSRNFLSVAIADALRMQNIRDFYKVYRRYKALGAPHERAMYLTVREQENTQRCRAHDSYIQMAQFANKESFQPYEFS